MNARAWWVGSCHKSCSLRVDDEEGESIQHGLPQNTDHSENGHLPCMDGGSWISWIPQLREHRTGGTEHITKIQG